MTASELQLPNPSTGLSQPGIPSLGVAYRFALQESWDEAEYLSLGTTRLVEFDHGQVEVLPLQTYAHQLILDCLIERLKEHVRRHAGGRVLFAPLPVRLASGEFREPDIIHLGGARRSSTSDSPEAANLVMEVVSEGPACREHDPVTKRAEYAAAGISGYWIVDPVHVHSRLTLQGRSCRKAGVYDRGTTASLTC